MSWAQLASELDAVLDSFDRRWASLPTNAFVEKADSCAERVAAFCFMLNGLAGGPTSGQAVQIRRRLARVAEQLQVLRSAAAAPSRARVESAMTFMQQFNLLTAGFFLMGGCARQLAPCCGMPAAEVSAFAQGCAPLVLDLGAAALQAVDRSWAAISTTGSPPDCLPHCLLSQSMALTALTYLCTGRGAGCLDSFASQGLPPPKLAAWLSGAVNLLLRSKGLRGTSESVVSNALELSKLLDLILKHAAAFSAHIQLLRQDGQLLSRLLDLLLPALSAAAVALQLPPERRAGHSWERTADLVSVLCSPALRPALESRLEASEQASRTALHSATSLAQHAPRADIEQQSTLALCSRLAELLGVALKSLPSGIWGRRVAEQVQTALQGLHPALQLAADAAAVPAAAAAETVIGAAAGTSAAATPKVPAQPAQPAAGRPAGGQEPCPAARLAAAAHLCSSWDVVLDLLLGWRSLLPAGTGDAPTALSGTAEIEAWLGAATAALQALLPLASLLQQTAAGQPGSRDAWTQWCSTAARLCGLAAEAASLCESPLLAAAPPQGCGSRNSLGTALWQLHSMACRAVQWAAAGGPPWQLMQPILASLQFNSALVVLLNNALQGYRFLPRDQAEAGSRHGPLQAMAAAHAAALHALAGCGFELLPTGGHNIPAATVLSLVDAAHAIPALPLQPAFSEAFAWAMHALMAMPEDVAEEQLAACRVLIQEASKTAQLAAVLAADGTLARLARKMADGAAGLRPVLSGKQATEAAQRFTDCLARMARAPAGQQAAALAAAVEAAVTAHVAQPGHTGAAALFALAQHALPPARELAAALLEWWRRPEREAADALELAQAAALRSCAYLCCANLTGEGGPAGGQGAGSLKCSKCRAVWYCGTACSHADWRGPGGHRHVCRALGEARQASRQQRQQAAGEAAAE